MKVAVSLRVPLGGPFTKFNILGGLETSFWGVRVARRPILGPPEPTLGVLEPKTWSEPPGPTLGPSRQTLCGPWTNIQGGVSNRGHPSAKGSGRGPFGVLKLSPRQVAVASSAPCPLTEEVGLRGQLKWEMLTPPHMTLT